MTNSPALRTTSHTSHPAKPPSPPTSTGSPTAPTKPIGYAEAEIPVYLLIDRDNHSLTVFSEPKDGRYQQISPHPWGATVELPAPVNITLDTEKLKDYGD
ncbi:hypothetical protein CP976_19980 [Streptomyces coeruleorubidus]|uniref:Putative restriction endonuclease domain-containing protein n=1 Tax=Streptomyces coeruleorubidus TaxID=116188 RepID=A0A5J6IE11_STRC4|nr:hypothetical protein CP976_19980 [Streptomyces coeruleorubidus]